MEEERIDKLILQRGLVSSRVRAEQIIRESGVKVNGKLINKTGKKVPMDAEIELMEEEIPWVSRGALKLVRALEEWKPEIEGKIFMDIGASTGGFTEVLLQNGANKVYCIDVGTKQLHPRIKENEKVINYEKTHVRDLTSRLIPELVDGCVIDVSFISLEKIFPFIHAFLKPNAFVIVLIKPQFEVGRENVNKKGLVKSTTLYPLVIENVISSAKANQLLYKSHIESPILGGDGNMEFLGYFTK
ncbi:MAG: TlyA family RNA methyltransferase [Bacteroidota bacterium]